MPGSASRCGSSQRSSLAVLIAVAGWRELEAQEKNVPRSRVIKDDAVAEVATQMPQSKEALGQLRALPRGMATSRIGDSLLRAVKEGLARDPATLPHTNWGREESSEIDPGRGGNFEACAESCLRA